MFFSVRNVYLMSELQFRSLDWRHSERFFLSFQDAHNQAGIAYNGGLIPLLKLLDSKNGSLQHNAAFALYGLADNEVKPVNFNQAKI